MTKESILVMGGAGYIGSILVPALLEKGYPVTVYDSLMYRQTSLADCCADPRFDFIRGDICDTDKVRRLISRFDAIFPLAAIVGAPACKANPTYAKQVNNSAQRGILGAISRSQKVIFPTTNSGYGVGEKEKFCTEDTPLRPISEYGKDKVEIEKAYLDTGSAITFRLATVFGMSPRMRLDLLVNDFVHRACRDGCIILFEEHFRRNYVHIRDVAKAFLFGLENYDRMKGHAYNVGLSSANLTKRELCEKIRENVPDFQILSAPIGEDADKRDYIVSNEKIETLGWRPDHTLDDGIRELVKGCRILGTTPYSNA